jgi:hypothetical protein
MEETVDQIEHALGMASLTPSIDLCHRNTRIMHSALYPPMKAKSETTYIVPIYIMPYLL